MQSETLYILNKCTVVNLNLFQRSLIPYSQMSLPFIASLEALIPIRPKQLLLMEGSILPLQSILTSSPLLFTPTVLNLVTLGEPE